MISSELRDKILEFIQSKVTIQELEEWLVPRLPALIKYPESSDADVVSAVELCLSEYDLNIRTWEDIVQYLSQILQDHSVVMTNIFSNQNSLTQTASSSVTPQILNFGSNTDNVIQGVSFINL